MSAYTSVAPTWPDPWTGDGFTVPHQGSQPRGGSGLSAVGPGARPLLYSRGPQAPGYAAGHSRAYTHHTLSTRVLCTENCVFNNILCTVQKYMDKV
jgi:hypothetical protein